MSVNIYLNDPYMIENTLCFFFLHTGAMGQQQGTLSLHTTMAAPRRHTTVCVCIRVCVVYMCICVCGYLRERERERERVIVVCVVFVSMCV